MSEIKYLGVLLDLKLNFTSHVKMIKNKAFLKLGLIKRCCSYFKSQEVLRKLHFFIC